jgi:hypothetical protein
MRGCRPIIPRRRIAAERDTSAFEDMGHGLIADVVTQLGQSTGDAVVAP